MNVSEVNTNGIVANRLPSEQVENNFVDLHPPLSEHEALIASDRCYFCYDAPCVTACPTEIDIPLFIRQIMTGTPQASGKTILTQNILGGMCARVCPTETLCEQACVREISEGKPVEIGRLQRYATDSIMELSHHPFERSAETGLKIAVIGAGPAGLACAHRLAMHGHKVTILDKNNKAGGLNEYGIAAYKSVDNFAQKEIDWLLEIGGIEIKSNCVLNENIFIDELKAEYNAVFLGVGLAGVNELSVPGNDKNNVLDAVKFIENLRQKEDKASIPIGRKIVVIGGGMTAVDAAVQSKLLGADDVSIVYRRERAKMGASKFEQDLATSKGVRIIENASPVEISGNEAASSIKFAYTKSTNGVLEIQSEEFELEVDQVFKAIGQNIDSSLRDLKLKNGKIVIDEEGRTSITGLWAGGDCALGGEDLTVTAVAQGRDAAESINNKLMADK
ncbi:MAG: NAD(P)-dependent oxidoreductase [Rhodobacteraceae bacterium]|nr:MAG: NAD(P)-dependent oxidoreductase [Paracoccaceae bacterium]|tara:strand:+ start:771 stop:2114 length:1344 start_codon:yes stop_codon:yes gene_type:complete